jgi:serine/threonine-protein kinase
MIGGLVGNFKIVEQIGEGGMGTVYRGIDVMLDRPVALKRLRPDFSDNPQLLQRFRTEAAALAKLNHPNIATLYSFFRHLDDHFMAMEFVEGETLDNVLRKSSPLSPKRAAALFVQVLDAIEHAHEAGILHRDIKPENVIVSDHDVAKVTDFGIARVLGEAGLTRAGSLIGTIRYMAPERVKGEPADRRSDIYSLAVMFYEMLAGRPPFIAHSEFELMTAHVEKAPTPITKLVPSIPQPVSDAVLQALAKSPDERPQTAGAFRIRLDEALLAAPRSAGPTTASEVNETRFVPPEAVKAALSQVPHSPSQPPAYTQPPASSTTPMPAQPPSLPPVSRASSAPDSPAGKPVAWQTYALIAAGAFLIGVLAVAVLRYLS